MNGEEPIAMKNDINLKSVKKIKALIQSSDILLSSSIKCRVCGKKFAGTYYDIINQNGKKRGRVCPICAERLKTLGIPVLLPHNRG
jgi:thymidine kinase